MNQEEVFGRSAHVTDFVSNLAPMYLEEEIFRKKETHCKGKPVLEKRPLPPR